MFNKNKRHSLSASLKALLKTQHRGFTILELLLVILILSIAIVPMVESIGPSLLSKALEEETSLYYQSARGTLTRIETLSFIHLENNMGTPCHLEALLGGSEAVIKESVFLNGGTLTPVVSITDKSFGIGGLLEIEVVLGHIRLKTLKAEY